MRPPGLTPYALAVALVVSAITVSDDSAESSITTRRPTMSFTRTRPFGSCRTVVTAPRESFPTTVTGPSWRMAGICARHTELDSAAIAVTQRDTFVISCARLRVTIRTSVANDYYVSATRP